MTMTIAPGTPVRVLRHPDEHGGSDEGPGVVTHVHRVDEHGVTHARVHVFGEGNLPDVHVVDSREVVDRLLAEHVKHLPRRHGEPDPRPHDVLPWVKVAYPDRPADAAPAETESSEPSPEPFLTDEDRDWIRKQRELADTPPKKSASGKKAAGGDGGE